MPSVRWGKLGLASLAAGLFFAMTGAAQASFTFTITDITQGASHVVFTQTSSSSPIVGMKSYTVKGATYNFDLTATSNSQTQTPGSNQSAIVTVSGSVTVSGATSKTANSFSVTATDNRFLAPGVAGNAAVLYADQNITTMTQGFSLKTKGQYQDANTSPINTAQLLTRFSNSLTLPSDKQTPHVSFVRGANQFSLSSLNFDIDYGSALNGGGLPNGTLNFSADAVVAAVPEPGSIALALIGIPVVFFAGIRRAFKRVPVAV